MTIRVIILDFDGVVVESLGIKTQAFRDLFSDYPQHLDPIMNYHLAHNAISRYIKFEYIVTHILGETYDEGRAKEIGTRFSKLVRQKIIECPYVEGAAEFLHYFSSTVPLYVASATPQEELETIINARGINKYFKGVYGTPWKKYEVVQKVMLKEEVDSDAVAYVGDSREDYKVAQATGIFFVGRINEEPFDDLAIPAYKDLFGVKTCLQRMMGGSKS
jgi:phosphoglycolate phosphatase-like HAD superfamily hydrolase